MSGCERKARRDPARMARKATMGWQPRLPIRPQSEIGRTFDIEHDDTGNLPPLPGIFPNTTAPVIRMRDGARALSMMRWGMCLGGSGSSRPRSSRQADLTSSATAPKKRRCRGDHQPILIAGSAMASMSPLCRHSSAERPVILAT